VSTEQQREEFLQALAAAEEWLYAEGADTHAPEYRGKLREIQTLGNKISLRISEKTALPAAQHSLSAVLNMTRTMLANITTTTHEVKEEDLERAAKVLADAETWLSTKSERQAVLQAYNDPVLTSTEIQTKIKDIETQVKPLLRKPKKKPPKVVKPVKPVAEETKLEPEGEKVEEEQGQEGKPTEQSSHEHEEL